MSSFDSRSIAQLAWARMCRDHICARDAIRTVWNASFSRKQRSKIYKLIEALKSADTGEKDASKHDFHIRKSLGEDF